MPKLELGSGYNPTPGYEHVGVAYRGYALDFEGDVRGLFCDDYADKVGNLREIPLGVYDEVLARHFVEHIEWIYQEALFRTIYMWLAPGGKVVVETPNFPYIIRHYTSRRLRKRFPLNEHPNITTRDGVNLQWWINFKLYSGCSPGDYHHTIYDAHLLRYVLESTGFESVKIRSSETLVAVAYVPKNATQHYDYF
jgi:predicted SAM-dependent methyltransferase